MVALAVNPYLPNISSAMDSSLVDLTENEKSF